jgi:hypothetical protein
LESLKPLSNQDQSKTWKIGITGHQFLHDLPLISNAIEEVLAGIKNGHPNKTLGLFSALAAGADTLAAESALEFGIPLQVILPFDEQSYIKAMSTEQQELFKDLIEKATNVIRLSDSNKKNIYEIMGDFLVQEMDCLIAVWNGQEARGPGGTGDVVEKFKKTGKPWIWIRADNMVKENPILLPNGMVQGTLEFHNLENK